MTAGKPPRPVPGLPGRAGCPDDGGAAADAGLLPDGWLAGVRHVRSPNCDARPAGCAIDLLVVHNISLPPGRFGGDAVERLFTNRLDPAADPAFAALAGLRVSAHFLVGRDGAVTQFVSTAERAWHAGVSFWRGRERCNDFSVGIELEGTDDLPFEDAQYRALAFLVRRIREAHPLVALAGHSDIAPARKTDPGPCFEWSRLAHLLAHSLAHSLD